MVPIRELSLSFYEEGNEKHSNVDSLSHYKKYLGPAPTKQNKTKRYQTEIVDTTLPHRPSDE